MQAKCLFQAACNCDLLQPVKGEVNWQLGESMEIPGNMLSRTCFPLRIYGTIVYLPTWMVDLYGKLVGKYT